LFDEAIETALALLKLTYQVEAKKLPQRLREFLRDR
jgi:hypothetical protein